jgi:TRAP-type C4-dicarboxylate transport system substrate-binding protein
MIARRFVLAAVLVMAFALSLAAQEIKVATLAPDGSYPMQEFRKAAAAIKEKTAGRVVFKFYPGGTMGNDKTVLRKVRFGQLQGAALTGGGLAEVYPQDQIYNLPFLFNSFEEVDHVRRRLDPVLIQALADRGFVSFGLIEGGFAHMMSAKPIRGTGDLKGCKVWAPEGDPISRTVFEQLGVSPIPLPLTDVLTGLQTGLIDTVGTSPYGAITLQWFTRVKYMTDVPLLYFYGTLVVDKKAFDKLAPADQAVVREVMGAAVSRVDRKSRADNQDARAKLQKQGVQFVAPTPAELDRWHAVARQATEKLGQAGAFDKAMLAQVEAMLREFRSGMGKPAGK